MDKSTINIDTLLDPKRVKENLEAHIQVSGRIHTRRETEFNAVGLSQKVPLALKRKPAAMAAAKKKK